jgi:uncharacterized protein (TIGR00369 family)
MSAMDPTEQARLVNLVGADTVPYWATIGIVVDEVHEPGHVTLKLPMQPSVGNRRGVIHGGAIMSLIDAAGGGAIRTLTPVGEVAAGYPTTDINVTFVNAARGDVQATGRVVRRGRSLVFVQVEVHDDDGTLIALARATYMVMGGS